MDLSYEEKEHHDEIIVNEIVDKCKEIQLEGLSDLLLFQLSKGIDIYNSIADGKTYDVSETITIFENILGLNLKDAIEDYIVSLNTSSEKTPDYELKSDEDVVNFILQNAHDAEVDSENVEEYKQFLSKNIKEL
jgi:hypothetical protein